MKSDEKIKKIVEWLNKAGLKKEAEELVRILYVGSQNSNTKSGWNKSDKKEDKLSE
tara:strand:+ start:229 stop:396 length:168 start_codon:yes stop_codon:yes gene_type:complete